MFEFNQKQQEVGAKNLLKLQITISLSMFKDTSGCFLLLERHRNSFNVDPQFIFALKTIIFYSSSFEKQRFVSVL